MQIPMATIRDVAEKANVHPSTVSRVFSGKSSISEKTRERVLSAAEELGFHPNAIARSLSIQQTHTIGIVVPHVFEGFFDDSFFPQIMRGMLEAAYRHDFRLIVGGSKGYEDEISQIKQIMVSSQADGIVVMSSRLDVDTVGSLKSQSTPFVLIGHPPNMDQNNIAWVDANNHTATQQAVEYLVSLGHTKIAYVGGDPQNLTTQERKAAYLETLEEAGVTPHPKWVDYGFFSEEGGYTSVTRMLKLGDQKPTAFYAANDLMAIGILCALRENGLRVPEDISVIGTNNAPTTAHTDPALSTIKVPYAEIAGRAVEMLIEHINKGAMSKTNYILDCSLVIRSSTAQARN